MRAKKEIPSRKDGTTRLIWGDNLLVMGSLLEKFAGKIDLIYIDPPFATGADFSFTTEIGESGEDVDKHQSVIEEKAYRDTWGRGHSSYLDMMYHRLILIRDLLSPHGSVYVHLDWHLVHFVRGILDEIFGADVPGVQWGMPTISCGVRCVPVHSSTPTTRDGEWTAGLLF